MWPAVNTAYEYTATDSTNQTSGLHLRGRRSCNRHEGGHAVGRVEPDHGLSLHLRHPHRSGSAIDDNDLLYMIMYTGPAIGVHYFWTTFVALGGSSEYKWVVEALTRVK
jgi:hypothetical protein